MTQDDIVVMAVNAGANAHFVKHHIAFIEKLAKLVHQRGYIDGWSDSDEAKKTVSFEMIANAVEAEREACAKVCDAFQARDVGMQPAECAGAIRARGEA